MIQGSQMEERHRARYGERAHSLHALSVNASLPKSSCTHQSGSSLKPVLWGLYGGFITQTGLIQSWIVTLQPANHMVGSQGNQPPSLGEIQ